MRFWEGAGSSLAAQEHADDRLLRRADWRFLLPRPHPVKSVCFARGELARAVEHISRQMVDPTQAAGAGCDLAVTVNPDDETLRAAWDAICPGGALYAEWPSPMVGSRRRVRVRLETVGFEEVRCYRPWPWSSHAPARLWLPLDVPGALQYVLGPPREGVTTRQGLRSALRRLFWVLVSRVGCLLPLCVTAQKPIKQADHLALDNGSGADTDREAGLLDTIRAGWTDWGLGSVPERFSLLFLTGGPRSISKVVGLLFADGDSAPRLAVKMPRVPEAVPGLSREAEVLRAINAARPGGIAGTPRVLFCQEQAGLLMLGETALTGAHLSTVLRRHNYRHLAMVATRWLAELAGRSEWLAPSAWRGRLIEPVVSDFHESFGSVLDPVMLQETADILATLGPLPLVCEQRDFAPWNVLFDSKGDLVVLDWESAELNGLPAVDLIYFLSYLAFFLDGAMHSGSFAESYRNTLDSRTFTGAVQKECLDQYMSQTGIDARALHPLRLLTWMLHSRSEYREFVADSGGRPTPDVLRRSVFAALWAEELRSGARRS